VREILFFWLSKQTRVLCSKNKNRIHAVDDDTLPLNIPLDKVHLFNPIDHRVTLHPQSFEHFKEAIFEKINENFALVKNL
jgi:hypothetical protein